MTVQPTETPLKQSKPWIALTFGWLGALVLVAAIVTAIVYGPWIAAFSKHLDQVAEDKTKLEALAGQYGPAPEWKELSRTSNYPAECGDEFQDQCRFYEIVWQSDKPYEKGDAETYTTAFPTGYSMMDKPDEGRGENCVREGDGPLLHCKAFAYTVGKWNHKNKLSMEFTDSGPGTPVTIKYRVSEWKEGEGQEGAAQQ